MKKLLLGFFVVVAGFSLVACKNEAPNNDNDNNQNENQTEEVFDISKHFGVSGFAEGNVNARNIDETSKDYVKVATTLEFLGAIKNKAKVIEITEDLNLGFNQFTKENLEEFTFIRDFKSRNSDITHPVLVETGVSQIEISTVDGMTIFSKNGATLKHAGFKISKSNDIVIRNLRFDGMWQWEDSKNESTQKIGDYDQQGWSFFKVGFSTNIWFDHLTFGKAYDGLIDIENSSKGVTISWSRFEAASGESEAFYKQHLEQLEKEYQAETIEYVYYKFLRDSGLSFDDIYELFRGQKKGFMVGGGDSYNNDEWKKNKELEITINNTYFYNLQDRLPRLRGGSGHVYNVYQDNNDIFETMERIASYDFYPELVAGIASKNWKLAFTNQSMVTTNGSAVQFQNSIFEGVKEIIKNNNKDDLKVEHTGKYEVVDSIYRLKGIIDFRGNSNDISTPFATSKNTPVYAFRWNTQYGVLPYEAKLIDLNILADVLMDNAGSSNLNINWLSI